MSIGATIRLGAEGHTLTMSGRTFDLSPLDRHKLSALASTLSETMGLDTATPRNRNKQRKGRNGQG